MKLNISIENMKFLWDDLTEKQRIELIKSLIFTAPDTQEFCGKIKNVIDKLEGTID